jgi:hypothetical protein
MGQQLRAWCAIGALAFAGACSSDDGGSKKGATSSTVNSPATGATSGSGGSGGSAAMTGSGGGFGNQPSTSGGGAGMAGGMITGSGGTPAAGGMIGGTGGAMMVQMGTGGMAAGTGGSGMQKPPTPHMGETCLMPGNGMYTEQGPYQVGMMDVDLGMIEDGQHTGMFTIFYPMPLETECLHPIVAWGNGTTVMGSSTYAFFNTNAASWGMVVAASQEDNTGSGNFHKKGIDYLLAQNEDSSSMFYHKLSTRAGVAGHSQGGFGAVQGSSHPNVETAVLVGASGAASMKVSILVLTGTMDIASGATTAGAQGPMFVASWDGGDHVTTETIAGYIGGDKGTLQMQRFYAAWFRCFLADDQTACKMFEGGAPDNCGVCKDMGWASLMSVNL